MIVKKQFAQNGILQDDCLDQLLEALWQLLWEGQGPATTADQASAAAVNEKLVSMA